MMSLIAITVFAMVAPVIGGVIYGSVKGNRAQQEMRWQLQGKPSPLGRLSPAPREKLHKRGVFR